MTWSENPQRDILEIFVEAQSSLSRKRTTRWSGEVRRAVAYQTETKKNRRRQKRMVLFSRLEAALLRRLVLDPRVHKANVGTARCLKNAVIRLEKRGYVIVSREGSRQLWHARPTKNARRWIARRERNNCSARRRRYQIEA